MSKFLVEINKNYKKEVKKYCLDKEISKNHRENEMALIEFDDGSRDIIKVTELNNGNFSKLKIGKKYSFKFENRWNLVCLKSIGKF